MSLGAGSALITAPDNEKVKHLIDWYVEKRPDAQLASMARMGGDNGNFARDCRLIHTVKEMDESAIENGMYLNIEAAINSIKIENVTYNVGFKDMFFKFISV